MKTRSIAILISAALMTASLLGFMSDTTDCYVSTHALADIKTIEMTLRQYKVRHGEFPISFVGLPGLVADGLLKEEALTDPWGTPYGYREPNGQAKAGVYSCGLDKVSSSQGNDRDDLNSWNSSEAYYVARRTQTTIEQQWELAGWATLVVPIAITLLFFFVSPRPRRTGIRAALAVFVGWVGGDMFYSGFVQPISIQRARARGDFDYDGTGRNLWRRFQALTRRGP